MKCVSAIDLTAKVSHLPETYQPIYGHRELSGGASRPCDDRLAHITTIYHALEKALGRPLKVLDLGCAQGFFSMSLAALGASVLGVDFLPQNVNVCRALAAAHPEYTTQFIEGRVEDLLASLEKGQFDLVLGLSVFHHITYQYGPERTTALLSALADKIGAGIFEMALKEEPLYWGPSQPANPKEFLSEFAFIHSVANSPTHLSSLQRPLIFASNTCWYLDGLAGHFQSWTRESHPLAQGTHQGTRRYFHGSGLILKSFDLATPSRAEINLSEYRNEAAFLSRGVPTMKLPRLISEGSNNTEAWILREALPGDLLTHYLQNNIPFPQDKVAADVLQALSALEEAGYHHNDVRPWNILIDPEGHATLIDYGAITQDSPDIQWPSYPIFAFLILLREIYSSKVSSPHPLRDGWLSLHPLPTQWQRAMTHLLGLAPSRWKFSALLAIVDKLEQSTNSVETIDSSGTHVLLDLNEQLSDFYKSYIRDFHSTETDLNTRIDDLKQSLHDAVHRMTTLETNLARKCAALESQEKTLRWFKQQWLASDQSRKALRAEYDALLLRVHQLDHHIAQIYSSNSWRITRPLRGFFAFIRDYRAPLVKNIKLALKKPCVRCVAFSVKYPLIRRVGLQILKIAPHLKLRLRNIAAGAGLLPPSPEAPIPEGECYPPTYSSIVYRKIKNVDTAEGVDANRH